nr:oxysterol-binding protein-related protein 10 [Chrysemys picta bellii]
MEKVVAAAAAQGGSNGDGGSNSSSRSSSRPTSAGSSPSSMGRGLPGRPAAGRLEGGGGGSSSSPGSAAASPGGSGGRPALGSGRRREPALEGALSKYTNLLQGWQSRYFVLDFETGILQYFVNEQSKNQKPRGALSLAGAIISLSDEVPHMLVVYFANGEIYKLRAADAKEKQYWVTQLRSCAKYHTEGNSKVNKIMGKK